MKTIKVFFVIGLLFVMSSCIAPLHKKFLRSYVMSYYSVDSIKLEFLTNRNRTKVIVIQPIPTNGIGLESRLLCSYGSTGESQILYDDLCMKHNDMSYNRTFKYRSPDELPIHQYSGVDFVSLRIVSDADFDEGHPAGTDLGDIVRYAYYSPKKYIDSDYAEGFDWAAADGLAGELYYSASPYEHPIEKLVSELTPDDLMLLGVKSLGALHFESRPTLSTVHHLTVTMTTDDYRELSASIYYYF